MTGGGGSGVEDVGCHPFGGRSRVYQDKDCFASFEAETVPRVAGKTRSAACRLGFIPALYVAECGVTMRIGA